MRAAEATAGSNGLGIGGRRWASSAIAVEFAPEPVAAAGFALVCASPTAGKPPFEVKLNKTALG